MRRRLIRAFVLPWLLTQALVAQQFQFTPWPTRPAGSVLDRSVLSMGLAGFVVGGDVDGDGVGDLVATSPGFAGVFLRSGSAWNGPTTLVPWSNEKPVLVDLDGDLDDEIVFVPPHISQPSPVRVRQGTAGGTAAVALPAAIAGAAMQGVAVGDVDLDGFADLVLAAAPGAMAFPLVLARGGPNLQFTLDTTSIPAGLPFGLWPELIDVDADGDLDVLATTPTANLRLLRNVGGAFVDATATLPSMRGGHTFLVRADFDADGHADCAAVWASADIDVLWGGPSGLTVTTAVASFPGCTRLWPADFDGDGDFEILAEHAAGLDVLWNQGLRQFAPGGLVDQPTSMRGTADVDVDGTTDVLFTIAGEGLVRCKYQARFEDASVRLLRLLPYGRAAPLAGDVDADGRTDLVTLDWTGVIVDRAVGGGATARATSPLVLNSDGCRAELADLDGDGDLDLVVKDDGNVILARNVGAGAFAPWQSFPCAGHGLDDLRVADVDADGDIDIVHGDSGIVLRRNGGGGTFLPPVVVAPAAPTPPCVDLVDVDGDGDLDVVTNAVSASGLTHVIVANDGAGHFAPDPRFYVNLGNLPASVRAGDFDGDGDFDLVVRDRTLRVYRNDGGGTFTDRTAFDLPDPPLSIGQGGVVVADFDADGDLDVTAPAVDPPFLLLMNDGNGVFRDRTVQRVAPFDGVTVTGPLARAVDIDDDGDVDLTAGGSDQCLFINHLRQCRSTAAPKLGGVAAIDLLSGPGFGAPGIAALGVAFAPAALPLRLPGLAGQLDLDAATLQILAWVTTSPVGVSTAFVPVPPLAALFGSEVWFQGAILPTVGQPGFTNAIYEVILR